MPLVSKVQTFTYVTNPSSRARRLMKSQSVSFACTMNLCLAPSVRILLPSSGSSPYDLAICFATSPYVMSLKPRVFFWAVMS